MMFWETLGSKPTVWQRDAQLRRSQGFSEPPPENILMLLLSFMSLMLLGLKVGRLSGQVGFIGCLFGWLAGWWLMPAS